MYQLIQILFQNFFSILCTNRSPSPVDFHSNETSADPHHVTTTPHPYTDAPLHTRKYVPTPPPPYRTTAPYHRTTAQYPVPPATHHTTPPHSQPHHSPHLQPHHCHTPSHTTTRHLQPHHCPHSQPHHHRHLQPHHCTTSQPHHSPTTHAPYRRRPSRRSTDAVSTPPPTRLARVAAGPTSTLTTAYRRRNAVTPPRHRPDASTPVAVPSGPQARL